MEQVVIKIREAETKSGCEAYVVDPNERHVRRHDGIRWNITGPCRGKHVVELRGLDGHVSGTLRAELPEQRKIEGSAVGEPGSQRKYSVFVDGVEGPDPYIVIEQAQLKPFAATAAALIGIAAAFITYRAVRALLSERSPFDDNERGALGGGTPADDRERDRY